MMMMGERPLSPTPSPPTLLQLEGEKIIHKFILIPHHHLLVSGEAYRLYFHHNHLPPPLILPHQELYQENPQNAQLFAHSLHLFGVDFLPPRNKNKGDNNFNFYQNTYAIDY